jgi:GcrA cell cycle regulator
MANQEWTAAEVETLRALWTEGLSAAAIGRRIFRPKNSVISKSHRLFLEPRPSPIVWNGKPRVRVARVARVPRPTVTLPPLPSRQEPVAVIVPPRAPGHANRASAAARASHTPSIFDNVVYRPIIKEAPRLPMPTTKTCQYLPGDGPPWRFCDEPSEDGSYCAIHYRRCHAGLPVRRVA